MSAAETPRRSVPRVRYEWTDFAEGVKVKGDCPWTDDYRGTSAALVAAGLVREDQLPGMPGMRKMRVTILPDGTPVRSARSNPSTARDPGAKLIKRASKTTFQVSICVTEDESDRRHSQRAAAESEARTAPAAAPMYHDHTDPDYQAEVRDTSAEYANEELDRMRRIISRAVSDLKYTAESEARILRVTDELRRAYVEARMVPTAPKHQAEGNVIRFPSRVTARPACSNLTAPQPRSMRPRCWRLSAG